MNAPKARSKTTSKRAARNPERATLRHALIVYDGPQLLLLETSNKLPMLAVAVDRVGMDAPFFGCQVKQAVADRYFEGRVDLRFLFLNAIGKSYYFFDLSDDDKDEVILKLATQEEASNEDYWPSHGLFSRSHTSSYGTLDSQEFVKDFFIDGNWEAADFSRFHGKMANLYSVYKVMMDAAKAGGRDMLAYLKNAISDRAWEGGGSYVSFYDDMRDKIKKTAQLGVARLQYASPGIVALRGQQDVLGVLSEVVSAFQDGPEKLKSRYEWIHNTLKKEGVLSSSSVTSLSSEAITKLLLLKCRELAKELRIPKIDNLFDACDQNPIKFAKVVMSIHRRSHAIFLFYAEGRVSDSPQSGHMSLVDN